MAHPDLLTETEFDAYELNSFELGCLEACRARFQLDRKAFRVLDWGCGRGKLVLWLRERGYSAVGVDVDARHFDNGADLFRRKGYQHEALLQVLAPDGSAPFPESSFHFVISQQTLEHVRDLDAMIRELRRVTTDGGEGCHIYPPHGRLIEPHLFMPFVHWVPKNRLRKYLIGAYVLIGLEPHWWPARKLRLRDKVRTYYDFSVCDTFYRTPATVRSRFKAQGFETGIPQVRGEGFRPSGLSGRWFENFARDVALTTRLKKGTLAEAARRP